MSRYVRTIYNEKDRAMVAEWLAKVPFGWRVTIQEPKRTVDQNAQMR